jgi:hypothetical protein
MRNSWLLTLFRHRMDGILACRAGSKAPGIMGDGTAGTVPGMAHGTAHPIDGIFRDKALEPAGFRAGFLIAQAEMGQGERKDTVPLVQELSISLPGR